MPGIGRDGYVLDVRADLFSHLATRTVAPLLPECRTQTDQRPNPLFEISGKRHGMVVQAIASIPGREFCWSVQFLTDQHDAVVRALDTLLLGF